MKNTSLCYIEHEDSYLMLHRVKKRSDENAGKWIGVGGKFMEGESPEECMLREVSEETGLTLLSWRFRGIITFSYDTWETEYMHLFTSDSYTGRMHECDEGILQWKKKSEIAGLPIWEGDRIFLQLIDSERPFFSLKLCYDTESRLTEALLDGEKLRLEDYI